MNTLSQALAAAVHDDPDVRQQAALRLGTLADATVAQELVELLVTEPDFYVRETLTWVVVGQQQATLPHLVEALTGSSPARAQVLHALSKIGDPQVVTHILPLADDPDPAVAAKAWWALGRTGVADSGTVLVKHLGTGDMNRRRALTSALEQLGAAVVPALAAQLRHDSAEVRHHAAEALTAIGDPGARAAATALAAYVRSSPGKDELITAISALGQLDVPVAEAVLEELRESQDRWLSSMADWWLVDRAERRVKAQRRADVLRRVQAARSRPHKAAGHSSPRHPG